MIFPTPAFFKASLFAMFCGVILSQCLLFDKRPPLPARQISSVDCSLKQTGAVVLMYHRFDGRHSSTSVTEELLKQHIQFFISNNFHILPLDHIVQAIKTKQRLPEKALAITIDDAYKSAYEIAHPLFLNHNIPYTVFVNTEGIDQKIRDYMSWDQLRQIQKSGLASLEAHSHSHAYMIRELNASEREEDIKKSVLRIYKETGSFPKHFAYPYGETHKQFINEVKNYKWNIEGRPFHFSSAWTTQSGPVGCSSSLFALPRFALNMNYGKVNELFRYKMTSRHFPVQSFFPDNLAFCSKSQQSVFSLTSHSDLPLKGLKCFAGNGVRAVNIKHPHQAEIILQSPLTQGLRQRINCTLPDGQGRVFWLGKEFAILKCL